MAGTSGLGRRVAVVGVATAVALAGSLVWSGVAFAAGPNVGIGSAAMLEGQSGTRIMRFTVSLSQASGSAVSMHYATTTPGTATSGVYFVAASGTLSIPATKTTGVVNVTI